MISMSGTHTFFLASHNSGVSFAVALPWSLIILKNRCLCLVVFFFFICACMFIFLLIYYFFINVLLHNGIVTSLNVIPLTSLSVAGDLEVWKQWDLKISRFPSFGNFNTKKKWFRMETFLSLCLE